ncbi:MAG: PQQ-binding-like beta-propeller repeat protein [Planctomycetota bacterium]
MIAFQRAVVVNAVALLLLGCLSSTRAADLWPQFRGPSGDGIVVGQQPPVQFEKSDAAWRTEIPGRGWSSPVVADGVIWMTTAIEVQPTPKEREAILAESGIEKKKYKQVAVVKAIDLRLVAVDLSSGKLLRDLQLTSIDKPDAIHTLNSYASPTPVIDGAFIYCHFGTYGTFCLDRAGCLNSDTDPIRWQRRFPLAHSVGPGSSPFIDGPRIVLIQDGTDRRYVVALDKRTGETVWETERPEMDAPKGDLKKAFCTPIKVTDASGRDQLICLASHWMIAYQPETGEELWKLNHGKGYSIVPRPVFADDVLYFSTGFGKPQLWAVRADGEGDVTDTHVQWTVSRGIPAKPSPLIHDGLVYVVDDNGVASCFDAANGDQLWKHRLGGDFSASPTLAGERLYFANHEGEIFVVQPGKSFELIETNTIDEKIMASPVFVQDALVVRSENALYRFDH